MERKSRFAERSAISSRLRATILFRMSGVSATRSGFESETLGQHDQAVEPIARLTAGDGLIGLAALVQVAATLPHNYIGFEYPTGNPEWWYEIIEGLPDPIVKDSFIEVWDRPGMGVDLYAFVTIASDDFVNRDFGITADQSASSGLPQTSLDGG